MAEFTTRPEIRGTFGVCASTHYLATAAGMAVLEHDGNAFDAACAMGFALQVVEPHMNGPAGEVPALFSKAGSNKVQALSGQGTAPAKATPQAFRDLGLERIPGTGLLPVVVPGAFDGWMILLRDHGTMRPREVLKYAIGYARDGFAVAPSCADAIAKSLPFFADAWPTSAMLYGAGGKAPETGSLFRNPGIADIYERVLREAESAGGDREAQVEKARDTWYRGFIAETIDAFCTNNEFIDTSGEHHSGLLRADDLAGFAAHYEDAVSYDYPVGDHVYTMCKTGAWTQGPVMLQQLALLKGYPIADMDSLQPDFVHTIIECAKLAFADREAFYGDPKFVDVPLETLLSDAYNDERRQLVGDQADSDFRAGTISGYGHPPALIPKGATFNPNDLAPHEHDSMFTYQLDRARGDTCHLDVIDKWGNMVAATPSGGWLSSSPAIPEFGFCLSTRGQMFWIDEDHPGCIQPGKRPRITLSPSLALRDGEPYMAFGTPGGDQQDQWPLHTFLRHVHFGMNLQEAIDAPNFHSTHFPGSFYPREWDPAGLRMEARFGGDVMDKLERCGHRIYVEGDWSLGRVSAVARDGKLLKAAANPRHMQGYAIGR